MFDWFSSIKSWLWLRKPFFCATSQFTVNIIFGKHGNADATDSASRVTFISFLQLQTKTYGAWRHRTVFTVFCATDRFAVTNFRSWKNKEMLTAYSTGNVFMKEKAKKNEAQIWKNKGALYIFFGFHTPKWFYGARHSLLFSFSHNNDRKF